MKATTWVFATLASLGLLSACGGKSDPAPTVPATVSSVSIDQVAYRKIATIKVQGQNLDKGITVSSTGCAAVSESAGGTAAQRTFTCKIITVGSVTTSVVNANNVLAYQATMTSVLNAQPQVTLGTSMGNIVIELNPGKAPVSVDNFLNYVESGFYVSKIFHRVEKDLVVQGGGYTKDLQLASASAPIVLESKNGLSNVRGTIGMARTSDLNSATSQFYFNVKDNSAAFDYSATNPGYAVFGKIITGIEIMDAIRAVPVSTQGSLSNVPVTPVLITSATRTQ